MFIEKWKQNFFSDFSWELSMCECKVRLVEWLNFFLRKKKKNLCVPFVIFLLPFRLLRFVVHVNVLALENVAFWQLIYVPCSRLARRFFLFFFWFSVLVFYFECCSILSVCIYVIGSVRNALEHFCWYMQYVYSRNFYP